MDKKEAKRDIAHFSTNLKNLMNKPLDTPIATLDRDIQHFIYGRVALLIRHNNDQPVGSLNDVSCIVGAAFCNVIKEFCRNSVEDSELEKIYSSVRENLLFGFDTRIAQSFNPIVEDLESEAESIE